MLRAIPERYRAACRRIGSWSLCVVVAPLVTFGSDIAHAAALEDIEFVAEHLPEVAMDNRYATLPLGVPNSSTLDSHWQVQAGFLQIRAGDLELSGPMLAASRTFAVSSRWQLAVFGFVDDLSFGADSTVRPLAPLFSNDIPLALPADARFDDFGGSALNIGFGAVGRRHSDTGWLGDHEWLAGLLVQRMALSDYGADYAILSGPDTGASGRIDYSADYDHIVPMAGLQLHRSYGSWSIHPRVLVAVPLPRRPVAGRISGPGFDIAGDTEAAGNGTHFGDPSLTLGLGVEYEPYRLTIDLGSTLTQALLEPEIHKGIDRNWTLSVTTAF